MAKAQHIGIVACSAEGAALCYRTVCLEGEAVMGRHDHPEVSLHTHSLAEYMNRIYVNDWRGVADLMVSSAEKLANMGADFAISPDNTIHQALDMVRERSPIPWLHIAEEVAMEAARVGYRRIGILGTRYLVESNVYPEKLEEHGLEWRRPKEPERERINEIIFEELVYGKFTPAALAYFQNVIRGLEMRERCDAVVLGCTEIPLLILPEHSPLPTLDSTRLLARAALFRAVGHFAAGEKRQATA